jgi:hypothetical protein
MKVLKGLGLSLAVLVVLFYGLGAVGNMLGPPKPTQAEIDDSCSSAGAEAYADAVAQSAGQPEDALKNDLAQEAGYPPAADFNNRLTILDYVYSHPGIDPQDADSAITKSCEATNSP